MYTNGNLIWAERKVEGNQSWLFIFFFLEPSFSGIRGMVSSVSLLSISANK